MWTKKERGYIMWIDEQAERMKQLERLIAEKTEDKKRLLADITGNTAKYESDGSKNSSNENGTEKQYIAYADFKAAEIKEHKKELSDIKFELHKRIDNIQDSLCRDILKRYYIDKKSLAVISRELHYSYNYIRQDKFQQAKKDIENPT